ncbi:MAG TPA: MFS transporter [Pyrinomonadaceae bacterium]|nr:MFS transporter [Pyrinomonadaceae bacterium]
MSSTDTTTTMQGSATLDKGESPVSNYSWYALALLTLVYVFNYLDRTIIYILLPLIKKEMAFSDVQLALLGSMSFVIFFTVLGIPFGRLADRAVRKNMIAVGLAVWSLFSGLTGFATGFWSLLICRVMVGVGEATLGPAALSLLSDYFPPRVRATVQAIYSSGIAVGAGLAFFFGGWLGQNYGWRVAFYALGFPGVVIAVLVYLLRERPRGTTETATTRYTASDWKILFKSVPLRYHYLGYGFFGLAANNLSFWGPTFLTRVYKLDLLTIGFYGGVLTLIAGVPGTILGGYLADKFRRFGRGGRMLFGALAALIAVPFWLLFIFSGNLLVLLIANLVLLALSLVWLGPAAADIHDIAGPQLRGLGIGVYFFAVIIAYGIGSLVIGQLSDWLGAATAPLNMRFSMLLCPVACLAAALSLWQGYRSANRLLPS